MWRWVSACALGAGLVCCFGADHLAYGAPPVEAFGNLPAADLAQISPDGKHLAIIKPIDGREKVVFIDLTKPDAKPYIVGMDGGLAGEVFWKSNDRAICIFQATLGYKFYKGFDAYSRALGVTLSTQTAVLLMNNAPWFRRNFGGGHIVDFAPGDPDHVYMDEFDKWDREFTLDLYKVDLTTGQAERAFRGTRDTVRYVMDGNDHILARIDQDDALTDHVFAGATEIYDYPVKGGANFDIAGVTSGSDPQFVTLRPSSHGTQGLYAWAPSATGSTLFEDPTYDLDHVIYNRQHSQVIGVNYADDFQRTKYFDPTMQQIQASLEAAYPDQSVSVLSKADDGSSFVVLTDGPRNPPLLSLYTPASHQTKIIEEAYPALHPSDLGEEKSYPYMARDGLAIHAYLTLPPGAAAHNLPTIIFPHGGPEARDMLQFDWWAQFMASRGYAVLQPNFRGSSGYGSDFIKAGDGEWAGKVQYDVQDGVKKLIADGIADPKRICIVGASYGGYMALAGATFSPGLYACAVSYAGPSDLDRLLYTNGFESEAISVWKRRIGADLDRHKLDQQSPADFADQVKIPVLLLHSERDTTVPIIQSEIEDKALEHAGKQVEFDILPGDDHYLEFADTRIELLRKVEAFLAAHIGDTADKAAH
ncbi:MAG TPA: alpha/beta fold hydrolase [Rhizomicrobium sp.]|jgi:dipeptidyl aminopeptidase/acylaminoacyl peptidase|nr:alpha/beta fold hydrolase [Rhizomicrobium sp.]